LIFVWAVITKRGNPRQLVECVLSRLRQSGNRFHISIQSGKVNTIPASLSGS
jgi:hypothetical protein